MSVPCERLILRCTRSSIYQEVDPKMNPDGYRLTVIHSRLYYFALSVCPPACVSPRASILPSISTAHTTWFNVTMADDVSRGLTLIELQRRAAFKGWSERWKDRRGAPNYEQAGVHLANIGSTLSVLKENVLEAQALRLWHFCKFNYKPLQ